MTSSKYQILTQIQGEKSGSLEKTANLTSPKFQILTDTREKENRTG
jgi:hypothetical protein